MFKTSSPKPELFWPPEKSLRDQIAPYRLDGYAEGLLAQYRAVRELRIQQDAVHAPEEQKLNAENLLKQLRRIFHALAAGFEHATPPADDGSYEKGWYCGILDGDQITRASREVFPRRYLSYDRYLNKGILTFKGLVPPRAITAYQSALLIFAAGNDSNIRIYSPELSDFEESVLSKDPKMFGRVLLDKELHFFLIAQWDLEEELQKLTS